MQGLAAILLLSVGLRAQTVQPVKIAFTCTEDDMQSFGLACTEEQPCPVYLELTSLDSSASRILVAGNLHTESATFSSILLASDDGGATWTEPHPRIRTAALDRIQFFDLSTGWVSGQMAQAIPRDPFFLLTTDAGKTWRQRSVFSESQPGLIEAFSFESRSAGTAIVNRAQSGDGGRYALLETITGGDSWSIRQITQQRPALRTPPAPSSAWRLRAVAGAYRVEKHESGQWRAIASFPVKAGDCKPIETSTPPPPTEEEVKAPEQASGEYKIPGAPKPPAKKKKP